MGGITQAEVGEEFGRVTLAGTLPRLRKLLATDSHFDMDRGSVPVPVRGRANEPDLQPAVRVADLAQVVYLIVVTVWGARGASQ